MKKNKLCAIIIMIVVGLLMTVPNVATAAKNQKKTDKAASGIFIEDIDIQGMSAKEIKKSVNEYVKNYTDKVITLSMDGNTSKITVGELGFYWSNKDIVNEAISYANSGNVIKRYKDGKDIEQDNVKFEVEFAIDSEKMKAAINESCGKYNIPHVNAALVKKGDAFTITESSIGRKIAVKKSIEKLSKYLLNEWNKENADFELIVVDDKPVSVEEDCAKVTDVLGTYSTSFTLNDYNRNMNMRNGINLINGTMVYPGETFSANALLEPWTAENGWYGAGTYVNGKVELSLGGGICQVSSTLYNAVLLAELDVVERSPHSMSVSYVPLAADAALAGTYKDLKFANNTDVPLYIEGIYDPKGVLTFNIYGKETREAGRTVKYVSETISSTYPEEIVTENPNLPKGERVITVLGHVGYVAKLWKEVYQEGELVSRDLVNTSSYKTAPIYVTVGTGANLEPETTTKKKPQKETEKKTEKQTEKKTERQTEKNTEKKTDNQADRPAGRQEETTELAR